MCGFGKKNNLNPIQKYRKSLKNSIRVLTVEDSKNRNNKSNSNFHLEA